MKTSLKNAVPIPFTDLQPGDRILVYGKPSDPAGVLNASTVVIMKQSDVAAKQEHDRGEWQKHRVGGVVASTVDPANGTITIVQQPPQV